MLIDCDTCPVRGKACEDCVVTVLLGEPPAAESETHLDAEQQRAIGVLADAGMVARRRARKAS